MGTITIEATEARAAIGSHEVTSGKHLWLCCGACLSCSVLQPDEVKMLLASPNPPLFVLSAIGQLLAVSDMRIESKTHMDESIRVLQEAAGSCEKIITTPIPLSYTR